MNEEFLNPYTFIPAFPRDGLPEPLRDAAPPSRDRLHPERWTGRIGVRLTVETPLLLLDTPRAAPPTEGDPEHRVYPVLLRNGRPYLPATSVKGMLRSTYEAITNSRFGVFRGHDEPLGFRRIVDDALHMEPVMVGKDHKLHHFKVAKLLCYPKKPWERPVLYEDGTKPQHCERGAAVIENGTVRRIVRHNQMDQLADVPAHKIVKGVAYITGRNIEGKKNERLFYQDSSARTEQLDEAEWERLATAWNQLIRDYRDAHTPTEVTGRTHNGRKVGPGEWISGEPGKTAWSPHIYKQLKDYVPLHIGTFCWALRERGKILGLYPVMVTRDVRPQAPKELLDKSLLPAPGYDELSPADRVFGWVAAEGSGVRSPAYRGRLRISPVQCDSDADAISEFDNENGLPLAILGQPKPNQTRFYLAESKTEPDQPILDRTPQADLYKGARGLRGRKAYWHHAGLAPDYWDEPQDSVDPTQTPIGNRYREFRRSREPELNDKGESLFSHGSYKTKDNEQRDKQNRSIRGWVKPTTVFTFTIEVRDLDEHELGALVWLLALPDGHYHRLGMGKPLGFGSVRLDIDYGNTRLSSGEQWKDYYRSPTRPLTTTDARTVLGDAKTIFAELLDSRPELRKIRDSFLAVAEGNPNLPVHYPRTRPKDLPQGIPTPPDPLGNVYDWFTRNEQVEKGRILSGRGRSLPPVGGADTQLSIYPKENSKKEQAGRRRRTSAEPPRNPRRRER